MIAAQVIGNDATITVAGQSGNFQLNVMLPLIAHSLLQSLALLGLGCRNLADHALAGFKVNRERLIEVLDRNPCSSPRSILSSVMKRGRRSRNGPLRSLGRFVTWPRR